MFLCGVGILCGSCESGGVSALLDRCVSCSNAFIVLVPLLGIVIHCNIFKCPDDLFWFTHASGHSGGTLHHNCACGQTSFLPFLSIHFLCTGGKV